VVARFNVASAGSWTSVPRPALPSKMKGPASFLGVIGPSTPANASPDEEDNPFGLGVRVDVRSMRELDCSRRALGMPGRGFLKMMSTGATVAFEVC